MAEETPTTQKEPTNEQATPAEQAPASDAVPAAAAAEGAADTSSESGEAPQDESSHIGEPGVNGLYEEMISYLKRFAGYPFVSASRITAMPKDSNKMSAVLRAHVMQFIQAGGTSQEDYMKAYGDGTIVFFQAHQFPPLLNKEDGLYDNKLPGGYPNKTISICRKELTNPSKFEPVIIQKTGQDTYNVIKGNPYPELTDAEIAEAIKRLQPNAVAQ